MDFSFIEDADKRAEAEKSFNDSIAAGIQEKLSTELDKKLEEATSGLKLKNDELLGEKKKLQKMLKDFDGLDTEKAREALEFLEKNEDAQLIKDGKVDELLAKKTSQLRSDHETLVNELKSKLNESTSRGDNYKGKFQRKVIDDTIRNAALKAGVIPEALVDILARANSVFTLGKNGDVEARDSKGNLMKNAEDLVITPENWIEGLKVNASYLWPASEGADADAGSGADADILNAMNAASAAGDMTKYRKLRAKLKKKE